MGILSDYFVASPKELRAVSARGVPKALSQVDAKGFGLVPLSSLAQLLDAGEDGVEPGDPVRSGGGYAWFVLKLTAEVVDALAALPDGALEKTSKAMASTEEVDWSPKEVRALLERLRELAREAKKAKKAVYLWTAT